MVHLLGPGLAVLHGLSIHHGVILAWQVLHRLLLYGRSPRSVLVFILCRRRTAFRSCWCVLRFRSEMVLLGLLGELSKCFLRNECISTALSSISCYYSLFWRFIRDWHDSSKRGVSWTALGHGVIPYASGLGRIHSVPMVKADSGITYRVRSGNRRNFDV